MKSRTKNSTKSETSLKIPYEAKKKRSITLLATDAEKLSTSSSMYHDAKSRISYHFPFLQDKFLVDKHTKLFQTATRGKRVLFVGGGNGIGILPFLCAKNGAQSVSVIDKSSSIQYCQEVAKENAPVAQNMRFHQESVLDVVRKLRGEAAEVPEKDKFDFLFIDWVSNLLTNDATLVEDLIDARDNLLKATGHVLPDSATLYATALNDYEFYKSSIDWWSNVYGFCMNAMKKGVTMDPIAGSVPNNTIVTAGTKAITISAADITRENLSYSCTFSLSGIHPKTTLNFLTVYTQISFGVPEDKNGFKLFSSPSDNNAMMQPVSFSLPEFIPLQGDEKVHVKMTMRNSPGKKGSKVVLSGNYPSGDAARNFEGEYYYTSYE